MGEVIYPSAQRGRTLAYEGRVAASTLQGLRQQVSALKRVAAETREKAAGTITIVDPAAPGAGYGTDVRTLALEMDEEQAFGPGEWPWPWQRRFTLGLRAHDPRWKWWPRNSLTDVAPGNWTVENQGNAPANPSFDVFLDDDPGGVNDVRIANLTLDLALVWRDMPMPDAAYTRVLHVDFGQRAAVRPSAAFPAYNPNVDMMQFLDTEDSDWWNAMQWGLAPGENELRVVGAGVQSWNVYWHDTSY